MSYGRDFLASLPPARVVQAAPAEVAAVTERELLRLGAALGAGTASDAGAAFAPDAPPPTPTSAA